MSIKQREDGNWEVFVSIRDKRTKKVKSKRKVCKSKSEAKRMEIQLRVELLRKTEEKQFPKWNKFLEEFSSYKYSSDVKEETADNYVMTLKKYTLPLWEDLRIDEIDQSHVNGLFLDLERMKKPVSSRKSFYKYLRGAFNYAVTMRYISFSPVPTKHFKINDEIIKGYLTFSQASYFLQKAKELNSEWYPIWSTALYTGLRNGELYALRWEDIKFEERMIHIRRAWTNKTGFKNYTKNQGHRVIELADSLVPILESLKECKDDYAGYVLPRLDKWQRGEQARELKIFLKHIGLPQVRFHDLRAIWATILMTRGVPPLKVRAMAGWKDSKTMDKYMRISGEMVRGVTAGLNYLPTEKEVDSILDELSELD